MSTRSGALTTARRPTLVRNAASRSVYEGSRRKSCMGRRPIFAAPASVCIPPAGGFLADSSVRERGEHLVGVRVGLHVVHDHRHRSVGRDEEGHSAHTPVCPAHIALLAPGAVTLGHLVLRIGEKRERQLILLLELGVLPLF